MDVCTTCFGNRYYVDTLFITKGKELIMFARSLLCTRYFIHAISFSRSGKYYFHLKEKETKAKRDKVN